LRALNKFSKKPLATNIVATMGAVPATCAPTPVHNRSPRGGLGKPFWCAYWYVENGWFTSGSATPPRMPMPKFNLVVSDADIWTCPSSRELELGPVAGALFGEGSKMGLNSTR